MKVLVINVGSTSLKFRLFDMRGEAELASGRIERVGSETSPFRLRMADHPETQGTAACPDQRSALQRAIRALTAPGAGALASLDELDAVGFKSVHARGIADSVFVTEDVIARMEDYTPLAPIHNPPYIEAFRLARELLPTTPLVGVFEPAFHNTIPEHARTYGIPFEWTEKHAIRRYGFHGASHRYMSERVPELVGKPKAGLRIISCHMGGSSSVCAIRDGVSVDTSMGFSPQSGLPNANRSGDLDPFIIPYLLQRDTMSCEEITTALVKNGGLKGISGLSGDVRDLEEAAAKGNRRAALAIDVLVHETRKYVGAYAAVLGGLDVLAFTGGIGENATHIRAGICQGLGFLGVELAPERNRLVGRDGILSTPASPVTVVAVLANEELVVARETAKLVAQPR